MPDSAIMSGEVTGLNIKTHFILIRIVRVVSFPKHQSKNILFVSSWQYPQPSVLVRAVVEVNAYIQHRHYSLPQKPISRAIGVPTHFAKRPIGYSYVMI